jgi:hypothetical protein
LAERVRLPPQLAVRTQLSPSHNYYRHSAFSNGDANPSDAATGRRNACIDNGFGELKIIAEFIPDCFPAFFCPRDEILASFARRKFSRRLS